MAAQRMETGTEAEQRQLRELRINAVNTEQRLREVRIDVANTELRAATPFRGLPQADWDEELDGPTPSRAQLVVAIIPAHNEQDGIAVSIGLSRDRHVLPTRSS